MENQILYKVVNIEGKGMGCVALKDIKPGTIILNEVPQYTIQHDVLIGKVIHQKLKYFLNSNYVYRYFCNKRHKIVKILYLK